MKKAVPVAPGSNWQALKKTLHPTSGGNGTPLPTTTTTLKRKRTSIGSTSVSLSKEKGKAKEASIGPDADEIAASASRKTIIPVADILAGGGDAGWKAGPGQFLAIDCEMVGVGPEGSESTLARVSIVNYHGAVILDQFVRPRERVTDYRTWVSGVREEDLRSAPSFIDVQKEVAELIKGRILIGHAITNDTQVLLLSHPRQQTRDTAKYAPLQGLARTKKPGLKTLAKLVLGVEIQGGEHSSVDDARATMAIYRSQKPAWESSLRTHTKPTLLTNTTHPLSTLDLSLISTTGVKPSANPRPKVLGLAATLRHARNEAEAEAAAAVVMGEEEAEERTRKKAKKEVDDGMMLNFDFVKPVAPVVAPKVVKKKEKVELKEGEKKVKKVYVAKGLRSSRGDEAKRPKSKESWWDEG